MIAFKEQNNSMQGVPSNEGTGFYNALNIIDRIERIASQNSKQQDIKKITSFFVFSRLFAKGFSTWSELDRRYFLDSLVILHRRSISMNGRDICFKMLNIIRSMQKNNVKIPDFLNNNNDNRNKLSSNEKFDNGKNKLEVNKNKSYGSGFYVSLFLSLVVLFCGFLFYKYSGFSVTDNQFTGSVVENKTDNSVAKIDTVVTGASEKVADEEVTPKESETVSESNDSIKNDETTSVVSEESKDQEHQEPAKVEAQKVDEATSKDPLIAKYETLAKANNPTAAFALGHQYEQQKTPEANASAKYWYEKAAQGGNIAAMYNLGVLLLKDSDHSNWIEGVLWLRKAANYGLVPAQYNLGLALSEGVGAKKDLEEAFIWFSLASLKQDPDSIKMRDSLLEGLDTAQKERAQALLSIWRPQVVDEKANESVEKLLPQQQE